MIIIEQKYLDSHCHEHLSWLYEILVLCTLLMISWLEKQQCKYVFFKRTILIESKIYVLNICYSGSLQLYMFWRWVLKAIQAQ